MAGYQFGNGVSQYPLAVSVNDPDIFEARKKSLIQKLVHTIECIVGAEADDFQFRNGFLSTFVKHGLPGLGRGYLPSRPHLFQILTTCAVAKRADHYDVCSIAD